MWTKRSCFWRKPVAADTFRHDPLQRDRRLCSCCHASPEHVGRASRWKHAELSEHDIERRLDDLATAVLNQRHRPGLVHLAEKHQRQVHAIGLHPFKRRSAACPQHVRDPLLLPRNGRARRVVEVDRDEEPHSEFGIRNSEVGIRVTHSTFQLQNSKLPVYVDRCPVTINRSMFIAACVA